MKRTKDTTGRNTLYSLGYYDMKLHGADYLSLNILDRISAKCNFGVEGRMKLCVEPCTRQ